uniref:Cilia- and flagella-associated protein 300 n=1 Tax=Amphimedon queenslandica TaxID=400682 RepID=A0A1X7SMF4_AMPQE
MSTDSEDKFEFTLVTHYNPLQDIETKFRETIELFEKWGMSTSRMKSHTFFFNKFFQPYQREAFAKDFFASSVVSSTLQSHDNHMTLLYTDTSVDKVTVEQVNASAVRESSGSIVKCFDEMIDEFLVSDELRKVSDPVYVSLYSTEERNEFLFKIFTHIVLGGPVNQ